MQDNDNPASLEVVMRHFGFINETWFRIAWGGLSLEEQLQVRREVWLDNQWAARD